MIQHFGAKLLRPPRLLDVLRIIGRFFLHIVPLFSGNRAKVGQLIPDLLFFVDSSLFVVDVVHSLVVDIISVLEG